MPSQFSESDVTLSHDGVVHETEQAVLLHCEDGENHWFPLELVDVADSEVTMPKWLAKKEGLL